MSDARGHFPDRGEFLALDQPPLRLHLLGEIAQHADRAHPRSAGVEDARESEVGREPLAAEPPPRDLPAPAAPRLDGGVDRPRFARVGDGEQVVKPKPADLNLGVAGEPPPGRVHGDESAVDVGGEDAVVDTLHHRGEEPLAPAHLLLRHPERLLHLLEGGHQLLGLLLRDRELVLDDHPGRRRAEGGGEEPLEADSEREQLRHRQVRGRLAAEQLPHDRLGLIIPHIVVDEALDLGCGEDGGRPRRDLLLARRANEGGGLRAVVGILLAQQRDHDEESDVHEERPKDPVADGVEP